MWLNLQFAKKYIQTLNFYISSFPVRIEFEVWGRKNNVKHFRKSASYNWKILILRCQCHCGGFNDTEECFAHAIYPQNRNSKIFQHMKKGSRLVVLSFLKLFFLIMKNGDTKSCTGYWFLSSSVGVSFGSAKSMWRPSNWALKRFGLHQLPDKMTAKGEPVDAVEDQKQEWHHHQEEPRNKIINSSVCTVKPNRNKFPLLTWKVTRTVFRCDLSQTFLLL